MKITKEQKGITLIALVITIIVLLILAGVVLATLNGNTSIIDNANNAVEKYKETSNADDEIINKVEGMFVKYMGLPASDGNDDALNGSGDIESKDKPTIQLDVEDITYGGDECITVTVNGSEDSFADLPTGTVNIRIVCEDIGYDETFTSALCVGKMDFLVSDLKGTYTYQVTASYSGDNNYLSADDVYAEFQVEKPSININF